MRGSVSLAARSHTYPAFASCSARCQDLLPEHFGQSRGRCCVLCDLAAFTKIAHSAHVRTLNRSFVQGLRLCNEA